MYSRAGLDLSRPLKLLNKSPIEKTDEQAKTDALKAGGKIIGKMPKLPFARGDPIPPPDKSHSYSGKIGGVIKDPLQALQKEMIFVWNSPYRHLFEVWIVTRCRNASHQSSQRLERENFRGNLIDFG